MKNLCFALSPLSQREQYRGSFYFLFLREDEVNTNFVIIYSILLRHCPASYLASTLIRYFLDNTINITFSAYIVRDILRESTRIVAVKVNL